MLASTILFHSAIAFLAGTAVGSFNWISWPVILLALGSSIFILLFDRRSWLIFILLGLALGASYFKYSLDARTMQQKLWSEEQEVILVGTVVETPEVYSSGTRLTVKVNWPVSSQSSKLKGRFTVFGDNGLTKYKLGQKIMVSGKINSDFGEFEKYHLKEKIYGNFFYPSVQKLGFNWYYTGSRFLAEIRNRASGLIEQKMPEPQGALLKAMVLGRPLPNYSDLAEKLRRTGLSHLAVVSGMHLVVLSGLSLSFFNKIKKNNSRATTYTAIIILIFIALAGGCPSIWRAGMMTGFAMIGSFWGRPRHSGRAIVWAAIILILGNPLLLLWDIGFQLSFLAVIGLVYLAPHLDKVFLRLTGGTISKLLSASLSAQIMTAPLAAYYFHSFSLISPIANILIVSFLPFIFALSLLFLLSGGLFPLNLLVGFILTLTTMIISWFSNLSWAAFDWSPSGSFLLLYYVVLTIFLYYLKQKKILFIPPNYVKMTSEIY